MDENIKLQPEEEGKEFGYFPFEELPPVTTQVVEEVIKCEIGNINIQHTDPIEINTDIHLPLKDDKLVKLQESDPHIKQLRKQWENKNLDQNMYTMENILKQKLIDNGLLYTPIVVPDVLKDCLLILAHDKQGHNGFRRTYTSLKNRYHLKGMKKSVYQHCTNCQVCAKHNIKMQQLKKRTLLITTPTNGIHSNGPNRRVPPSIQQRQQIRLNRSMHAHRIHVLHSTEKQTCRGCDKSLHRPHMLYFWTIKKDPHRQWHQVQKQTLD